MKEQKTLKRNKYYFVYNGPFENWAFIKVKEVYDDSALVLDIYSLREHCTDWILNPNDYEIIEEMSVQEFESDYLRKVV